MTLCQQGARRDRRTWLEEEEEYAASFVSETVPLESHSCGSWARRVMGSSTDARKGSAVSRPQAIKDWNKGNWPTGLSLQLAPGVNVPLQRLPLAHDRGEALSIAGAGVSQPALPDFAVRLHAYRGSIGCPQDNLELPLDAHNKWEINSSALTRSASRRGSRDIIER